MPTNTDRQFDVRTLERNLETGRITREQYEQYLAQLPDASENAAPVEAEYVEGILKANNDE